MRLQRHNLHYGRLWDCQLAAELGARSRTSVLFALHMNHILTHEIRYKCQTRKCVGRSSNSGWALQFGSRAVGNKVEKGIFFFWLPFCASESAEPYVLLQLWWILGRVRASSRR